MEIEAQTALYAALVKAQAAARGVEKDATNKFHHYNYVSAEAMIREAKQLLSDHDLAIVPTGSVLTDAPTVDGTNEEWAKNARAAAVLCATWLVVHKLGGSLAIESGWPVAPEKGRPIDKACAAARTASLSYLLRDLLQIPRVEEGTDLDHNSRDEQRQDDGAEGLTRLISAQLDRLGKKTPAERTAAVLKANNGKGPANAAEMQRVVDALKATAA